MKKVSLVLGVFLGFSVTAQEIENVPSTPIGDPKELEEVIIKGNRIDVPFSQTTRDIQVISREEIEALPVKSLNEVLTYVSGVDVRQRGPFGTQTDIAIDGGSSEQTLVLIDGVKMIDAQTAHNMMNIPVPLNAIERIEVIRGAAARIYGINSLTGAINIVTKKQDYSSVTVNLQGGSSFQKKEAGDGEGIYGGGALDVTGVFATKKTSHLISVGQSYYNGQRYNSAANNTRLFYKGSYDFNENHEIQAMGGWARSRFGANGFYAAPGDINSEELVNSSVFSISSKHRFGKFTLSPRISTRYGEDDYRYFKDKLDVARSKHYANALMMELNSSLWTRIGMFGFGVESRLESINSSNIGQHKRDNHGAYIELKGGYVRWMTTTLGVYANYNSDFGFQVYPGIDLAFLVHKDWKISASIGSGQRIPSFTDLYLNQAPGNVGNPLIKPENAWNYEINVQYKHKETEIKAGYFYRDISNFIDWVREVDTVPYSPINLGNNMMQGAFARIQQRFSFGDNQGLSYQISYNFLYPSLRSNENVTSKYVLESLQHQLMVGVNYHYKNFSIQVQNRLLKRELGNMYDVLDARVSYMFKDFVVYTEVNNILNTEYKEAGAVPMPSRWFSLGVRYQWNHKK